MIIQPDFPDQGERPWGDKLNVALQQIVDQSNWTNEAVTNGFPIKPSALWNGAQTLDATTALVQTISLTGNAVLTLAPGVADKYYVKTFIIQQTPPTASTLTWPTNVEWAGDIAPLMPTVLNSELIVHLMWTGFAWRGLVAGVFFP